MDAETARIMNVTLMGLALMGSGLAVLYESRSQTSYRRTARWAERTGLPLLDDADPLWPSIAASMRRTMRLRPECRVNSTRLVAPSRPPRPAEEGREDDADQDRKADHRRQEL